MKFPRLEDLFPTHVFRIASIGLFCFGGIQGDALVYDDEPFNSRRIPIEMQSWWQPNFGHVHAGTKLPLGQEVSGVLDFDVRIVMHNNPGTLYTLSIHDDHGVLITIPLDEACPYDGEIPNSCSFNIPVSLDTTQMQDGWRELRIRAQTLTPDGKKFLNSAGIPINVQNGGADNDKSFGNYCDNKSLIGRGWYTDFDYTNAIIECVPQEPISGTYTFGVRSQKPSAHLNVSLDKTHHVAAIGPWPAQVANPGQTLFDADGDYGDFFPITIDTTTLADGWHTLAVTSTGPNGSTSDCEYCDGEINHPSGVSKIWFYVQNDQPDSNVAPFVLAGLDQSIDLGNVATLAPTVIDDGLPTGVGGLTFGWSLVDGPGIVSFSDLTAQEPEAQFSELGVYTLELTVSDGEFSASDTVLINVIPPASSIVLEEFQTGSSSENTLVSTDLPLLGVSGDLYIASIATKSHVDVVNVSGLGLQWSPVASQCAGRHQTGVSVWSAQGPVASDDRVMATLSSAPRNAVISVSRYSNEAGPLSVGSVVSGNTNGLDGTCSGGSDSEFYSVSIATAVDGSVIYSVAAMRSKEHEPGPGFVEYTEVHHGGGDGDMAGLAVQDRSVRNASVIVSDGSFGSSVDWAVLALEIRPEAAEISEPPLNQAPVVNAGFDQAIELGSGLVLSGMVTDDGLPLVPGVLTYEWVQSSGPGSVVFADSTVLDSEVQFSEAGVYLLTLMASDGAQSSSDDVSITVNASQPPTTNIQFEEVQTGGSSRSLVVETSGDLIGVAGDLYLAAIATKSHVDVVDVAGLGLEWLRVHSQCAGRHQTGISLWAAKGIPTHHGSVTATLEDDPRNAVIAVSRYSGVHPSEPGEALVSLNTLGLGGACDGGRDSRDYSFEMTTFTPGAMIYTAAAMRYRTHENAEGFVKRAETHHGSSNGSKAGVAVLNSIVGSPGSRLVEGEFSGNVDWAVIAVAIRPGSSGGPSNNLAPFVEAGDDQLAELGSTVILDGAVTDDGLPSNPGSVTTQWTQLSGPGSVIFDNEFELSTSAQFPALGVYELALAAFDGELTSMDQIAVEISEVPEPALESFPGAVGFGRFATGGRGGNVYFVTNLNDSGPGSLRDAVEGQGGPRTVVFAVSGYIDLVTQISIENPDVTIAGQTSPGGITLRGARLKLKAGNVIVRGMRFRPGDGPIGQEARNRDGWSIGDSTITVEDVIFDHCSATWAQDENGSNYYLSENVTIQRCLFAECLPASDGAPNGFGYLLVTAPNTTFFQNAFFSNADRNPKIRSLNVEVINNLGYNWKASGLGVSDSLSSTVHGINNFYVHGPESLDRPAFYLKENGAGSQSIYLSGNIDSRFRPDPNHGDEWDVAHGYESAMRSPVLVFEPSGVSPIPADQVPAKVLAEVGAITPERDSIDQRILNTLASDTGAFLLSQDDVGGYPPIVSLPVPVDSDLDGMPDSWEDTYGLDRDNPNDRNGLLPSGYTNLEGYINSLIPGDSGTVGLEPLSISGQLEGLESLGRNSDIQKRELKVAVQDGIVGISFSTEEGETYQIFSSRDLEMWMRIGDRVIGGGGIVETKIPFDHRQPWFFKVERVGPSSELR